MRAAYQELLSSLNKIIVHEVAHHEGLRKSCFWIYINLSLILRRLLFTYAVGRQRFSRHVLFAVTKIWRDVLTVNRTIIRIEERRVALKLDHSEDQSPERTHQLAEIEALFRNPAALRTSLKGQSPSAPPSSPVGHLLPQLLWRTRTVARFTLRHAIPSFPAILYGAWRVLQPAVIASFTGPLLRSILTSGRHFTKDPVIRTFIEDGRNTGLDPQADFIEWGMCAPAFESLLLRERFTYQRFREVAWHNYLAMLLASPPIAFGEDTDRDYRFFADYLYSRPELGSALRTLDRTVQDFVTAPNRSIEEATPGRIQQHLAERRHRLSQLSDTQIFTYVKHFVDHGV